jgi:hypothetical protein
MAETNDIGVLGEASDEEIERSIIPLILDVLVEQKKAKEKNNSYYNNIILLNSDNPAELKNKVQAFEPNDLSVVFNLTNLQLSNLVPTIQIYKIYKSKNSNEELEVLLPFPDYTQKDDLEAMFSSRVGRGSGVGIKSFEWNSLAKNQSNLAQFSAKLTLYLQDASELVKIRNQELVGGNVYTASILDLLYPTNKDGNKDNFDYDPENFFLKIKVGWENGNTSDPNAIIDKQSLKWLSSEYYLTLYRHNIEFLEDGSINLTIDFIAMAEALLDDNGKSDIFFDDLVDSEQSNSLRDLKNSIREKKEQISTLKEDEKEKAEEELEKLQSQYQEQQSRQKTEKFWIYKNFFSWLKTKNLIEYINIDADKKQSLKIISTYDSKTTDSTNVQNLVNTLRNSNIKFQTSQKPDVSSIPPPDYSSVDENAIENEYKIDPDKVVEQFIKNIENDEGIIVPYFYLGDMLEYFLGRYAPYKDPYTTTEVLSNNIKNKKLRLVLGTFSYADFGNSHIAFQNGGTVNKTSSYKQEKNKQKVIIKGERKIANLAHIPISFKTFLNWFNSKIIDSNLEKYTLNRFIREVIYDLVPANLSNRILKISPAIRINLTMNSESLDDLTKLDFTDSTIAEYLQQTYSDNKNNYIINFEQQNPFKYLRSIKNKHFLFSSSNKKQKYIANYVFLFSNNEIDRNVNRNFVEDLKNSILHFYVGEEKGMIKNISFSREDNPRLDAHNIQVANKENQGAIIRSVYNAKIEMFGNNIFVPGNMIFLNPTYPGLRVGDDTLLSLGLGGYYVVISASNRIQSGLYTTTLETKWQSFGSLPNLSQSELEQYERQGYIVR